MNKFSALDTTKNFNIECIPVYTYQDPFNLPKITWEQVQNGHEEGIFLRGDCALKTYQRRLPSFIEDPDGCNYNSEIPEASLTYRQPFFLSLKEITVIGTRTLLKQNGSWLNDQSYANECELDINLKKLAKTHNRHLNEATGFYSAHEPKTFNLDLQYRMEATVRGRTLVACSLEPEVYGSWIFRVLPKLYSAQCMGLKFDRILIETRPQLLEYFDLLDLDRSLVTKHDRNVIYHLEHALVPSMQNSQLFLDFESLEFYKHLRARFGASRSQKKIFISRLNYSRHGLSSRVLLNEEELVDVLRREGFQIIFPETLSIKEQIELFSSAKLVIGPSGSALFNAVFCHPNTKLIDIESEPFHIRDHISLFGSLNIDYGLFIGCPDPQDDKPIHKRWKVNIPALLDCIQEFEKS